MDFEKASKKDIENLVNSYKKIKSKYGVDLDKQEKTVIELTKEKREKPNALNNSVHFQYLLTEIKPLLQKFEGEDREIVKQYFRYISEQKSLKTGFSGIPIKR